MVPYCTARSDILVEKTILSLNILLIRPLCFLQHVYAITIELYMYVTFYDPGLSENISSLLRPNSTVSTELLYLHPAVAFFVGPVHVMYSVG